MTVESILLQGKENAISTADLVVLTGAKNTRSLQNQIERERLHGALILSASDGGYFLPDDGEKGRRELDAFVHTLRSRAINTLRTLRVATKALRRMDDAQLEILEGMIAPDDSEL